MRFPIYHRVYAWLFFGFSVFSILAGKSDEKVVGLLIISIVLFVAADILEAIRKP